MINCQPRSIATKAALAACTALAAGVLAAFSTTSAIAAQEQPQADADIITSIDGKTQTLYTSQNGLPSTVTTAIAQTPDGFIWIGGYEGLTCFDGQIFEHQTEAPKFSVASLLAAQDGTLWIGTGNQGLYRYANGAYEQLDCSSCNNHISSVSCMAEGPDGSIVIGSEHGLVRVGADQKVTEALIEGMPETLIRSIAISSNNAIAAVTQDSNLFLIQNGTATEITLQGATGTPRCVSFDPETQNFYVGTSKNTVCVLSPAGAQLSLFEVERANSINSVTMSKEGVAWICADNGVYSYHNGTTLAQNLQMNNSVDAMLVDTEGDYWFVSSRQGTLLVANTPFKDISSCANLSHAVVNVVVKYDGKLIVGTDSGVAVIDPNTDSEVDDPRFVALEGLRIRDFKIDRAGRLWAATASGGVLRMDQAGTWTSFTKDNSEAISTNNFRCLYETDAAMIAGGEEGAVIIDDAGVRNVVDNPSTLNVRIMSICQMGSALVFGTDSYGLFLVKNGTVTENITVEDGLPSNSIMKIYPCSSKGSLLLTTSGGLAKVTSSAEASQHHSEGAPVVSTIDSFPATNVLDLIWQDSNTVWVTAGNGIYRSTEASLLGNEPMNYKLYTRQDGLPYDATANSRQLIDGNLLYLCGTGGVSALDTTEAAAATNFCVPSVTGAYADGQLIPLDANNTITIPAHTQRVKIMAHATTFNKTNVTLYYKLDGYDSHETITPLSNFSGLEYTNIDGGTYQLHFGAWDETANEPLSSATVTIKKEYGLLDHPATRIAGIAGILGLIALAFAWRHRRMQARLQKEYEEKERQALEKMAYSDFLTEAYSRNYLNKWVNEARAQAYEFPISLVTVDLNNLKQINDTLGHLAGDDYLRRTTKALFEAFGTSGIWVVRLGGDEFLVIAEGTPCDKAAQMIQRAEEILDEYDSDKLHYSFCYGMALIQSAEFSLDEKLRLADEQMMETKRRYHETHDRRRQ